MMKGRTRTAAPPPGKEELDVKWEVRPCGMLVQKRSDGAAPGPRPPPAIRVRVKYGGAYQEISLSPESTFGDLKRLLAERTGLHAREQKLIYKDREREDRSHLDTAGVKDRSKMVLVEDPTAQARRVLEQRKTAKMEKAAKAMAQTAAEIERLATKVSALEVIGGKGKRVAEGDVVGLIDKLMNLLVKLDGLVLDKDNEPQREMQVKRVQKLVEALDILKERNSQSGKQVELQKSSSQPPAAAAAATEWQNFDLLSGPPPTASAAPAPRIDWEQF